MTQGGHQWETEGGHGRLPPHWHSAGSAARMIHRRSRPYLEARRGYKGDAEEGEISPPLGSDLCSPTPRVVRYTKLASPCQALNRGLTPLR